MYVLLTADTSTSTCVHHDDTALRSDIPPLFCYYYQYGVLFVQSSGSLAHPIPVLHQALPSLSIDIAIVTLYRNTIHP